MKKILVLAMTLSTMTLFSQAAGFNHNKWGVEPIDMIINYEAYTTSFDSADDNNGDGDSDIWGIPEWVAYEIKTWDGVKHDPNSKRWKKNQDFVTLGIAPTDATYGTPGINDVKEISGDSRFVRGHMCPRATAYRISETAVHETYRFVNSVPQLQWQNSGIWADIEEMCNNWANKYSSIWVVCGPVFIKQEPSMWLGQDEEMNIAIPDALFKVVIRNDGNDIQTLAFLIPNIVPKTKDNPDDFITSIARIEKLTGLQFLTKYGGDMNIKEQVNHLTDW